MAKEQQFSSSYSGIDRRITGTHWAFKKEITLGHIFSTLTAVVAGVGVIYHLDQRITNTEHSIELVKQEAVHSKNEATESRSRVAKELEKLNSKIDRLLDRAFESNGRGK